MEVVGGMENPRQFRRHAMYFASRGMIAITPEYRLFNTHGKPIKLCSRC